MTTISDVSTEHIQTVITEYNRYIVNHMAEEHGPVAAAQLGATLLMAGLGFVATRAAEEMAKLFPKETPDEDGPTPG